MSKAAKIPKTVEDLDRMEEHLNQARVELLRARGWTHSSDNPACIWLWQKPIDGRVYLVDAPVALQIEEALDVQEDAGG